MLRLTSSRSSQSVSSLQTDFGKIHTNGLSAGEIDESLNAAPISDRMVAFV